MKYPVAIHHDKGSAYGVSVPDIPGCYSAGDTLDEALENTVEAITGHICLLAESGEIAPVAGHIDDYIADPDYDGVIWGFVDVDVTAYSGKTDKINVTLPRLASTLIDGLVKAGKARNRSAFLTEAALEKLAKERKPENGQAA